MRFLTLILITLLVALQYRIWVGEGSLAEVWQLRKEIETQRRVNEELAERNRRLHAEVLDLKEGLDAVEERARREFGMIRKGEVFYQILE